MRVARVYGFEKEVTEARRVVRGEAGRQDIKVLLPSTMIPGDGRCVTARERYGLLPDEVAIVTENGTVAEIVAGLCRAWASAGKHPIERAREFIACLPVLAALKGEP